MDEFNKLTERITFKSKLSVSDGMGGRVHSWADDATVWAWVEPVRYGNFSLDKIESESSAPARSIYRVRVRTGNDFSKAQRLTWRNKTMRMITRPVWLPDKKWVEFQVVEVL